MNPIQKVVQALIKTHGGLRAAARHIDLDAAYLMHLRDGTKDSPSDEVLAKLGLVKQVTYRERK